MRKITSIANKERELVNIRYNVNHVVSEKKFKVAVSGTVGAGKSTVLNYLHLANPGSRLFGEPMNEEVLNMFYKKMKDGTLTPEDRIEMTMQFGFLADTLIRESISEMCDETIQFFDRPLTDHIKIFSKMNMPPEQYMLYDTFQHCFMNMLGIKAYDVIILLEIEDEENYKRIQGRGRKEESATDKEYFASLNKRYKEDSFYGHLTDMSPKVIKIDVTNLNDIEVGEKIDKIVKEEHAKKFGGEL